MPTRFHLRLSDPSKARGSEPGLAFRALSAEGFAEELQNALREDGLFKRWQAAQPDPDAVDPALGATDPNAVVSAAQHDLAIDLIATTSLPGPVLRHRLRLLAGHGWALHDVTAV
ncbi:MAG: hypothetical protein COW59_06850 [Lysobacterales bacterium CG17_big_fil_post_rev_8_21_14_2_50_64_11]|nr:MAG: hypothetical protein COW59_06850 [Xanthomonadales bacterium CG17_big_fil_post_rev_8_21_14_2_50_64_11]PIX60768.1 MAG: hypothetical protein COZ47_05620 [Xanthomonadales bacterium CG_4_10_14_3_um_filter_64_11]